MIDYKKKYDEVLSKAKSWYVDSQIDFKKSLETLFPELKESEDEKIRKELLEHCKNQAKPYFQTGNECPQIQSWIAWLEKQGEPNLAHKPAMEAAIKEENVGNPEPKFKIDDWIVQNGVNRNPVQITSFEEDKGVGIKVWFSNGLGTYVEFLKGYHKWTLEDAKDGDVLSYVTDEEDLWIMIYRSLYEPYEGHVHYHALLVNDNFSDKGTCCICIDNLKPATKEQRDTLLKAIADAGYTFDFEKKELKKIEQKPVWSEEDEKMIDSICISINEESIAQGLRSRGDSYKIEDLTTIRSKQINWLKSLKERIGCEV